MFARGSQEGKVEEVLTTPFFAGRHLCAFGRSFFRGERDFIYKLLVMMV